MMLYRRATRDWTLLTAWHRGSEASGQIDPPRRCWSRLDALRQWREVQARREAAGLRCWFARIENHATPPEWLEDHRGTLRHGGNGARA